MLFCQKKRETRFTFCLFICRLESSTPVDEGLAGELWLRWGWDTELDDRFVIHVHDRVEADIELDEEETLRVSVVIGVFNGQSTHDVEWR